MRLRSLLTKIFLSKVKRTFEGIRRNLENVIKATTFWSVFLLLLSFPGLALLHWPTTSGRLNVICARHVARQGMGFMSRARVAECSVENFDSGDGEYFVSPKELTGEGCEHGETQSLQDAKCSTVIDLTCKHPSRVATYHRVADCLAYEYWTLKTSLNHVPINETCLVGYLNRMPYYRSLGILPELPEYHTKLFSMDMDTACISYHYPAADVVGINHLMVHAGIEDLLNMLKSTRGNVGPCEGSIILVNRTGTRSWEQAGFRNLVKSFSILAQMLGIELDVHNSGDDTNTTIHKFHRASAVIAFHGAALANLLFSSENTFAIEISTFSDLQSSVPWRSVTDGFKRRIRPDLTTEVYRLSLESAFGVEQAIKIVESGNANMAILRSRNIRLSEEDVQALRGMVHSRWMNTCRQRHSALRFPTPSYLA